MPTLVPLADDPQQTYNAVGPAVRDVDLGATAEKPYWRKRQGRCPSEATLDAPDQPHSTQSSVAAESSRVAEVDWCRTVV